MEGEDPAVGTKRMEEACIYIYDLKINCDYRISRDNISKDGRGLIHRFLFKLYVTFLINVDVLISTPFFPNSSADFARSLSSRVGEVLFSGEGYL